MYCSECKCEYIGWTGRCPGCAAAQPDAPSWYGTGTGGLLAYDDLVDQVREQDGRLELPLTTAVHITHKKRSFPYFGYGFAWARQMESTGSNPHVSLRAARVGTQTERRFPYIGRGYAWVERFSGHVGGNSIALTATELRKERTWAFPYAGFGRAWAARMEGTCGDQLRACLQTTKVARRQARGFPYVGYGYGWVEEATLSLTLQD